MLAVLPGRAEAGPGAPGVAVPLYAASQPCDDPRYPALAGPWVVACGTDGRVDRAVSLDSGRVVDLPRAWRSPGLGPGVVYVPGVRTALLRLTESGVERLDVVRVTREAVAPPAADPDHVVVLGADGIEAMAATAQQRRVIGASPLGWQPPALSWPWVAWVEDAGRDGADVLLRDATGSADAEAVGGGPGRQDRVVAQGDWLAWVDEGEVVVRQLSTGSERRVGHGTGFSAAPALYGGEVCWEERTPADGVDIACTDWPGADGPGHQQWPMRWDRWLLWREGDRVMLWTAPSDGPSE